MSQDLEHLESVVYSCRSLRRLTIAPLKEGVLFLYIYIYIHIFPFLSFYLFFILFFLILSVSLFVCLRLFLSACVSIALCLSLALFLPLYLSVSLSLCLFIDTHNIKMDKTYWTFSRTVNIGCQKRLTESQISI